MSQPKPKTGDGRTPRLGMTLWWPWSHDGISGPHPAELFGIGYTNAEVLFCGDVVATKAEWDSLFAVKRNAEKCARDWRAQQNV